MLQILSVDDPHLGTKRWLAKLTLLVEGVYHHHSYGVVDYSRPVLEQIKRNHDLDVLGYRIPLYLGHASDRDRIGSSAAVGYLLPGGMTIETDEAGVTRLFGVFEFVRQDVYEQVWRGEYSYGSVELVTEGLLDKRTGEPLGYVLTAHTLTCEPYIPNMVPNRILGLLDGNPETSPAHYVFHSLHLEETMAAEKKVEKDAQAEVVETPSPTEAALGLVNEAFTAYREEAERRIQELTTQCEELQQKLQAVLAEKRQAELENLVKEIHTLNLPVATKEKYIPLIRENSLNENEMNLVMDNLRTISQHMGGLMFQQFGVSGAEPTKSGENPYEWIIESNAKQKQSRS